MAAPDRAASEASPYDQPANDFTAASGRPGCMWTAWFFAVFFPVLLLLFIGPPFGSFDNAGGGLLWFGAEFKAFFLGSIALALGAFVVGHVTFERRALWAGFLFAASLVAAALGVALLPATLLGLGFFFLSLIGLSPFASAACYYSGALHLYSRGAPGKRRLQASTGFALFFAIAGGLQLAATNAYEEGLEQICSPELQLQQAGVRRLERWAFLLDSSRIRAEHSRTSDPVIKAQLDNAYYRITGNEIERPWTPRSE